MSINPLAIEIKDGSGKLTISTGKLVEAIKNSIWNIGDLNFGQLAKSFFGTLQIEKDEEVLAFELVFNPLLSAIYSLVIDKKNHFDSYAQMQCLKFDLEDDTTNLEIILDERFFEDATKMEFLKVVKKSLEQYLPEVGLNEAQIKSINHDLPNRYLEELMLFWNEKADDYEDLLTRFTDNPFYKRSREEQHKLEYYNKLRRMYFEPAMGDPKITLNDVYIMQNFKVYEPCFPRSYSFESDYRKDKEGFRHPNNKIDIHEFTEEYFLKREEYTGSEAEKSGLMLLLGQPGQGKTSFCSRTAYDLLNNEHFNKNFYLIRLRDIISPAKFIVQPLDEIKDFLEYKKLEFSKNNTILILDGLDELYMSAGLSNSQISDFFSQLTRIIRNSTDLSIIITSRYNYVDIESLSSNKVMILRLEELSSYQQKKWLEKYRKAYPACLLTPQKLDEINDNANVQFEAIRELISQPILLHIVARADFAIDGSLNRAAIYDKLFTALIDREWKPERTDKHDKITKEDLRKYLGVIALKIYQSPFEYITQYELKELPETKIFLEDHDLATEDINSALKEILVNFYFRNIKRKDDDEIKEDKKEFAIEFLHKSLQEYLAAERIYNRFLEELTNLNRKDKYIINTWQDALRLTWEIFSPKEITKELNSYIKEIIKNDKDEKRKKSLSERMSYFFAELLKKQFIWEYRADTEEYYPIKKALNTFYGYWLIFAELLPRKNHLSNELMNDFVQLLIVNHGGGIRINLTFQNLSNADLRNADLSDADLSEADLSKAVLSNAVLDKADLSKADLSKADLSNADLNKADLSKADLSNADLSKADLDKADLSNADLSEADLSEAVLSKAVLSGADLSKVVLLETDLRNADLSGADLRGASLSFVKTDKMIIDENTNLDSVIGLDSFLIDWKRKNKG